MCRPDGSPAHDAPDPAFVDTRAGLSGLYVPDADPALAHAPPAASAPANASTLAGPNRAVIRALEYRFAVCIVLPRSLKSLHPQKARHIPRDTIGRRRNAALAAAFRTPTEPVVLLSSPASFLHGEPRTTAER